MIFIPGQGNGGGSWRFITATELPATVAKRTFLAVTATIPGSIVLSDGAPESPATGDLWFHITDPGQGRVLSDGTVPFQCWGAYQWSGTAWTLLTAYYSYLGAWKTVQGLPPLGTSLENCTWEQIGRIAEAGKATDYFVIGDTKSIVLTTAETLTLRIIDFAHDDLNGTSGGKAAMTFDTVDCMNDSKSMNSSATNVGGYSGSAFYNELTNVIFHTLPEELQTVVKTVTKKSSAGSQSSAITTTGEQIFLFSEVELHGTLTYSKAGEGTQYALYTSGGSKVKKQSGSAIIWWTRSPSAPDSASFCSVSASGAPYGQGATTGNGIAFGLCI